MNLPRLFRPLLIGFVLLLLCGCDDFEIRPVPTTEPPAAVTPLNGQSLRSFIADNNLTEQPDSLIACAFSGDYTFLPGGLDEQARVLAYFYFGAGEFLYFHSTDRVASSGDLTHYLYRAADGARSVANDFFEVLPLAQPAAGGFERMIVARVVGDKAYLSNVIFLLGPDQPTANFPGQLRVVDEQSGTPTFSWPEGPGDNVIYFQLLTDATERVVSATYTVDTTFTYYQTDNVVLNLSPAPPPPVLAATGQNYRMTVMGVGSNNWVNFIRDVSF